jgi:glycosyltransferase involved in cell wall biosynthesis
VDQPGIAVIVPTYEAFDYSRRTLLSLFKYTPNAAAIVVDDGSPNWNDQWYEGVGGRVITHRFEKNGGLTRSWNKGLRIAENTTAEYTVCGNNDILFTTGWWRGMVGALKDGLSLTGPLSNAPGVTAKGLQGITLYVKNYVLTDDPKYNNRLATRLYKTYHFEHRETPVNGFFMMARTETWVKHAYDAEHAFKPVNHYAPSGRRNPTPLMTCNEDELQSRWRKAGLRCGVALGSYIFHYRSVSRGKKFAKGQFLRIKGTGGPV